MRWNLAETTQTEHKQEQSAKRFTCLTKMYHACREHPGPGGCVYCGKDHRPVECTKIKGLSDHKQILLNKCLCLCLGTTARSIVRANQPLNAATSVTTRQFVTHQTQPAHGVALTTNQTGEGLSPVVITEVNRFKCRALTNSEAGSLYVLAKLIKLLRTKPTDVQTKAIDMLMSSKNC